MHDIDSISDVRLRSRIVIETRELICKDDERGCEEEITKFVSRFLIKSAFYRLTGQTESDAVNIDPREPFEPRQCCGCSQSHTPQQTSPFAYLVAQHVYLVWQALDEPYSSRTRRTVS